MKATEFCYWLQGFFELADEKDLGISAEQAIKIKRHLDMVFIHDIDKRYPKQHQAALNEAHGTAVAPQNQVMRC